MKGTHKAYAAKRNKPKYQKVALQHDIGRGKREKNEITRDVHTSRLE